MFFIFLYIYIVQYLAGSKLYEIFYLCCYRGKLQSQEYTERRSSVRVQGLAHAPPQLSEIVAPGRS